jgi:DNA-binding transcriptional LysR family regulator
LRLEQRFDVPSVLERRLLDAHLDLAILSRPVETGGLSATALALETFLCVAAPSLLATLPKERHERALRTWPWLVFDHDLPMHLHWWKTTFGKTHPPNNVIAHLASLELLEAFAIAGLGVTILPDYLVAPSLSRQTLISVDRSLRPRRAARNTLFSAWRTGAPMTARLQAVMRALVAPLG